MEIIGHRGSSYLAPENTLASVNLAWDEGADAVEIDIRRTKDGKIAVIHDPTMRKLAGKQWRVSHCTLEQLRGLDVGRWKGKAWAGERVAMLEEVLHTVPRNRRLWIEIKSGPKILPELECVLAAARKSVSTTPIISFSFAVLAAVRRTMPDLPIYWVRNWSRIDRRATSRMLQINRWIAKACDAGFDGLDLGGHRRVDAAMIEKIHGRGLKAFAWTVNTPADARRLKTLGIDGITTDRPGWLREQLEKPADG